MSATGSSREISGSQTDPAVGERCLLGVRKHTHAADTQEKTFCKAEGELRKQKIPVSSEGWGF